MSEVASGFRVHYFRDLENPATYDLRTVVLDSSVPLVELTACPACGGGLSLLCTFVAHDDTRRMRMGVCQACGWWGYMDRPSKEWIVGYYANSWDNAAERDIKEEARTLVFSMTQHQRQTVHLAEGLSKESSVCDIGCGKGAVLKEFQNLGFTKLMGVENSEYRAAVTQEKWGFPVFAGNFEGERVQRELKSRAPINIFFSYNVFEHIYDPHEIFAAMSALQREGDHVILSMPNVIGEPKILSVFWLPHLHGWTPVALEKILNRYGYEVVNDITEDPKLLTIMARKTSAPKARYTPENDYKALYQRLVAEYFFLDKQKAGQRYAFCWTSKAYKTYMRRVSSVRILDDMRRAFEWVIYYLSSRLIGKFSNQRSVVISTLEKRYAPESPIEVQFDNEIELLIR